MPSQLTAPQPENPETEAIEALHRTLTEIVLPRLHMLRISLEVLAAQLRHQAEESSTTSPRIVH